jgi:hypothetical protein
MGRFSATWRKEVFSARVGSPPSGVTWFSLSSYDNEEVTQHAVLNEKAMDAEFDKENQVTPDGGEVFSARVGSPPSGVTWFSLSNSASIAFSFRTAC